MVGNNSVSGVDTIYILVSEFTGVVPRTGQFLDFGENWGEEVGVIVGSDIVKHRHETLEAETSVDVFGGKSSELAGRFTVVLNEDDVPDFENVRVIHVDEMSSISATDSVKVDLADNQSCGFSEQLATDLHGPQGPVAPISGDQQVLSR